MPKNINLTLTDELVAKLADCAARGLTSTQAAKEVGVVPGTLIHWLGQGRNGISGSGVALGPGDPRLTLVANCPSFLRGKVASPRVVATTRARKLSDGRTNYKKKVHGSLVYFIRDHGDPSVKIGVTTNLTHRMYKMNQMRPRPAVLLATMPGDRATETALHKRFAAARISGEWFDLTPELFGFIFELVAAATESRIIT